MKVMHRKYPLEFIRCILLAATALWLAHPYFSPRLIGAGDALWYHHLLADAVTQFRAGVFPVFVGQSDFSFNGAVYPLRAAPYYQYLAGLLDFITGHALSFFALQHLTVILSFLGGAFVTYFSLLWIAPERRWTAAALAALYILCPGVAGLFYAQDLYMSGMTLPWVPLACAATLRSFDDDSKAPLVLTGVSLAALWWAHSPIALWTTLVAGVAQLAVLAKALPKKSALQRAVLGGSIFAGLAAYPILSVFLMRTPGETIVPYLMDRAELLREIHATVPGSLLPLNPTSSALTHLQLGYSLWLALLVALGGWVRTPRLGVGLLLASTVLLLTLVFPIPGLTRALWFSFPETLVGMTLYWPMQRLIIVCAALVAVCAQRTLTDSSGSSKLAVQIGLGLAGFLTVGWSITEAGLFIRKARAQADTVEDSRRWSMPENVAIQRHTYGLFPGNRPAYFTHGVVDPRLEFRLLDPTDGHPLSSNYDLPGVPRFRDEFSGVVDANPGILNLRPEFTLNPGEHYLLTFDFNQPNVAGVLQIIGPQFYREYVLPLSGEPKAFGSAHDAGKSIALWTTTKTPQTVGLRFIPEHPGNGVSAYIPFARFRFALFNPAELTIQVDTLIPMRATVHSLAPALLETPRMFIPGYSATVDGSHVPIRKSAQGLVAFPVPSGISRVELRFTGSIALHLAFWISLTGWLGTFCWVGVGLANRKLRQPPSL